MRKMLFGAALAAIAVALVPAATATTSKTVAVMITRVAFVPKTVTITAGDTVKWTNDDTRNQQVTCAKCPFTSPVLKPTQSYSYTFKTVGKFPITDPLDSKVKGSVTVTRAPTKAVTLAASPRTVTFKHDSTLSGTVSNKRAGENVILLGQECGQAAFTRITTTTTGTGGTFSVTQVLHMNTSYEAKWRTATSTPVKVNVRPAIRLAKIAAHRFSVRVKTAKAFAGKYVLFQKKTATGWVKVRKVTLRTVSTIGTTTVTKAKFRSKIRRGKHVRILMTSGQAAPCYVSGHSNVIRS